jgi:hypothetical protein
MKKLAFLIIATLLTACATAQYKTNLIVQKTSPLLFLNGTGAQLKFYSDITLTQSTGKITLAGGNLDIGANNILGTGSLGATGAGKLTKVWAINAEFTNPPTINGVSVATTYATLASPTFTTGITTPAITLGATLITANGAQINYLNTATSNIQTQVDTKQATLVSGTNIKTVGGITLLGSGDIPIAGTGTVTSVAVTTANGVSASIANPTSAANMTFTLGAITPTTVNSITLIGASTPRLTVTGTSAISGTNTGDNSANTLYSGLVTNATHTGQVTGSGALTIAAGTVTLANMANMAPASVIYRKSSGTGVPEVQTLATLKTDLGLTGTNSGDQTNITGNAATATILQTARNINGTPFNGSANVSVPSNITPSTAGNVMVSDGAAWTSDTPVDIADVALPKVITENYQTSSYVLALTDATKLVTMDSASPATIEIPLNSAVAFPTGTQLTITNLNSGTVTITATNGVNIRSLGGAVELSGQYAVVHLIKLDTNAWLLYGDITL